MLILGLLFLLWVKLAARLRRDTPVQRPAADAPLTTRLLLPYSMHP